MTGPGHFTDDFKRDAVAQISGRGSPVAEVSKRLSVSQHSLYAVLLGAPELGDDAIEAIGSMIERIVATLCGGGGVELGLHGALARILAVCSSNAKTPPRGEAGFLFSVVAGAGFHLNLRSSSTPNPLLTLLAAENRIGLFRSAA